jgi:Domain of unknown function (DUF4440)
MTMKSTLLIAALCLAITVTVSAQESKPAMAAKPSASALEAKVRESWEQFKKKDKAGYAAELAAGYQAVEDDGDGARDAKAEVAEIDEFELSQYTLKDFHVAQLGTGAALVTYTAEYSGTAGGQSVHDKIAVAEVWVKRGSDWKELYSQDTKVK